MRKVTQAGNVIMRTLTQERSRETWQARRKQHTEGEVNGMKRKVMGWDDTGGALFVKQEDVWKEG